MQGRSYFVSKLGPPSKKKTKKKARRKNQNQDGKFDWKRR